MSFDEIFEETRASEFRCASDRTRLYMSNIKNISQRFRGAAPLSNALADLLLLDVDLFDS